MTEIELPSLKCKRCGYTWNPRTKKPRCCPRCKSPYWDKPYKGLKHVQT